jgi:hypothetical protein
MDYLHEGKIGRIEVARALCYKGRGSIGAKAETQPPDGLDYDLWCGPAPKDPVMRKSLHYDWHWIWNYGNGDLGNQGIHEMDRARWGLNKNTLCNAVYSYGGRFGYEDAGETANTQVCLFDYGDCKLFFEVRGLGTKDFENQKLGSVKGAKVSVIFEGTDGYAVSYNYSGGTVFSKDGQKVKEFKGGENHFANFLKAVRSRKHTDLTADIEEGHLSSALCHLGNISYRMGEVEKLNPNKKFDLELQQETFDRFVSHLKDNKVEVDGLPVRFGKWLGFNPKTEKFLENSQANAMLTREYRAPFVVPEKF